VVCDPTGDVTDDEGGSGHGGANDGYKSDDGDDDDVIDDDGGDCGDMSSQYKDALHIRDCNNYGRWYDHNPDDVYDCLLQSLRY